MTEHQHDLWGGDDFRQELLEAPQELRGKWPKDLAALCDIYERELAALGVEPDQASQISLVLLMAQANYGGGRVFYLPRGDRLRKAVRDRQIWRDYKGNNHEALAHKYGLTVPAIYRIVDEQRTVHRAKVQPQLPL